MADNRFSSWKEDDLLNGAMKTYVKQGLKREEAIDFLRRDFPQYAWSIRTLDRLLRHFGIYYKDDTVSVDEVKEAVTKELEGPGKLLGYRGMHKKVRQKYDILVTRDQVYDVMSELDPEGLAARGGVGAKKMRRKKGNFSSKGPNWVHSLDGHDKLMGYQNSTFPVAIYGCLDTASRKLLWLRVWNKNCDPKLIGRWYMEYLMATKLMPAMIKIDKGTETGTMATIHAFLRRHHTDVNMDPVSTILYGPSTSNQIERWWKELHERMEKFFKSHLTWLKDQGHYNPHDDVDRKLLSFIMIPVVQRELDIFKDMVWNSHRIRAQKDTVLPDGIPNHIYSFPEQYGLEECGLQVTDDQLQEAAIQSRILDVNDDFLTPEYRAECERIIDTDLLKPADCKEAFLFLKQNFSL